MKIYNHPEPPDELLRLFDEHENEVEPRTRQWILEHTPKLWHGAGCVWVINSSGQVLCSKRSDDLKGNPGKWQTYFGGKVPVGSTPRQTAVRELEEEAGLEVAEDDLFVVSESVRVGRYIHARDLDVDAFRSPDGEVTDVRWLRIEEYRAESASQPDHWCNGIHAEEESRIRQWISVRH